jgi:hypothetical protein
MHRDTAGIGQVPMLTTDNGGMGSTAEIKASRAIAQTKGFAKQIPTWTCGNCDPRFGTEWSVGGCVTRRLLPGVYWGMWATALEPGTLE